MIALAEVVLRKITDPSRRVANVTQWCKRSDCWNEVKGLSFSLPHSIENCLITVDEEKAAQRTARKAQKETNDINAQVEVVKYPASMWVSLTQFAVMKSAAKGRAVIKVFTKKKAISNFEATVKLTHELIEERGCENVALIGRKQGSLFPYQVIFSAEGTEYNVASDLDIFEGEAMKSLQAILQIIYRAKDNDSDNPIDDLIAVCDKVNRYQIQLKEKSELRNYLEKCNIDTFEDALNRLRDYPKQIKNQSTDYLYDAVQGLFKANTVEMFMEQIIENFRGFEKDFMKADDDVHYKNPQFVRLKEISGRYGTNFRQFYRDIDKARRNGERSRKRESDITTEGYEENQKIRIHLITATRSKGKEFDAVIILDADMDEWPNQLSTDIEEERRLFYVAMTRAKQYLYFVITDKSTSSRFLLEAKLI